MLATQPLKKARPVIRWHGGKWRLAPWIISHFPKHRVYVEPFGGGASVLLRKDRSYGEVYNDLETDIVNLFRVLRDEQQSAELIQLLQLTPFAREEWRDAYLPSDNAVETARRLIVRSFMGFGSDGWRTDLSTGFRANSNRSGTTPAHDWANYPEVLPLAVERLRGVVIESRDAIECMIQHDGADTLHYVDPPYMHETRNKKREHAYNHELTDDDHRRLLMHLKQLKGMVILSGYPTALYAGILADWKYVERPAYADGARERTEALWLNPKCSLQKEPTNLFSEQIS